MEMTQIFAADMSCLHYFTRRESDQLWVERMRVVFSLSKPSRRESTSETLSLSLSFSLSLLPLLSAPSSLPSILFPQDFTPRIHISGSDFASITEDGKLCDQRGQLGPEEFELVMRKQVPSAVLNFSDDTSLSSTIFVTRCSLPQATTPSCDAEWQPGHCTPE